MIVISIIAVLASIAVPKFIELLRRSQEGASKGSLGSIRSVLKIYYAEMETYPADLAALTLSTKYLDSIPAVKTPSYHPDNAAVRLAAASDDAGGWLYDNVPGDANFANVVVNCTHTDSKGSVWAQY